MSAATPLTHLQRNPSSIHQPQCHFPPHVLQFSRPNPPEKPGTRLRRIRDPHLTPPAISGYEWMRVSPPRLPEPPAPPTTSLPPYANHPIQKPTEPRLPKVPVNVRRKERQTSQPPANPAALSVHGLRPQIHEPGRQTQNISLEDDP